MVLTTTVDPLDVEIWSLEASYLLPTGQDRTRIVSLLRSNRHVVGILKEAAGVLQSVFGSGAQLYLHLDHDPESDFEEIFATVRSAHPPDEGLQLMADFDQRWWLTRLPYVQGRLNFIWEPLG